MQTAREMAIDSRYILRVCFRTAFTSFIPTWNMASISKTPLSAKSSSCNKGINNSMTTRTVIEGTQ